MAIADEIRINQNWGPDGYKCDKAGGATVFSDTDITVVISVPQYKPRPSFIDGKELVERWLKNRQGDNSGNR